MLNEEIIEVFKIWLDENDLDYDKADEQIWLNELEKLDNKGDLLSRQEKLRYYTSGAKMLIKIVHQIINNISIDNRALVNTSLEEAIINSVKSHLEYFS